MITVGTDTYVTIAEADAYIELHYLSTDTQRVAWEAMTDADKEICLRNATVSIDTLIVPGRKIDSAQTLSFPRVAQVLDPLRRDPSNYIYDDDIDYNYSYVVPDKVKYAQIEESLELASPSSSSKLYDTYNGNVKEYRITGLSETFAKVGMTSGVQAVLKSQKAQKLMSAFVGGSYAIY